MARAQDIPCRVQRDSVRDESEAVLVLWRQVFDTDAPQPA